MKRFLLACLGMVLLGAAGLLVLHQFVESPSPAQGQPPGVGAGLPAGPGRGGDAGAPAEPGQYKEIVPPLLGALADSDGAVRQLAAATLVKIGPDAVAPLTEGLKAKDRDTRGNAAYVLGHLGPAGREALPALAKALKDEDKEVRRRAAYALHNLVSRGEGGAPGALAAEEGGAGAGGLGLPAPATRPLPGGGSLMTGVLPTPLDPGLLLPATNPPAKPEKEKKD